MTRITLIRTFSAVILVVSGSYLILADVSSSIKYLDLVAIVLVYYAGVLAQATSRNPQIPWPWKKVKKD